jgi:hypothetical protein
LAINQPYAALVATAGAFSVGFGLFQRLSSIAIAPMFLALAGMTISAAIGTLASASPLSEGVAAAIWAFAVAVAARLGTAMWWIVLQWSIALVIAAAFPAEPLLALLRGALVALGGGLQLVMASTLWALICWRCGYPAPSSASGTPLSVEAMRSALRETLEPGSVSFRYAVALAITVGLSAASYEALSMPNGY